MDGLHATGCVVLTGGDPEWGDLVDGGEVVVTEREPYQVLDIPSPCDSVGPCRSSGSLTGTARTYSSASKSRCFECQSAFRNRDDGSTQKMRPGHSRWGIDGSAPSVASV